jgi:hypothetical protein
MVGRTDVSDEAPDRLASSFLTSHDHLPSRDDLMMDLNFIAPGPDAAPDQLVIHRGFWGAL